MIAYTTTAEHAEALCARVADLLGMPWKGRDAATGVERTDDVGLTTRWVAPLPHPSDPARAAVPIDDTIREIEHPEVVAACAAAEELGADWIPPGPGG